MARIHNFSAGPAVLPVPVLEQARDALLDFNGSGLGAMECSHRSPLFDDVINSARERMSRLLQLDDDQEVLFIQGGASLQFCMTPMNLLRGGRAAYLNTGTWATKAMKEATRFGQADELYTSKGTGFNHVPAPGAWGDLAEGTAYLHYTSNNTVAGTQFHYVPDAGGASLVCDASSDILCRPLDGSKFDIYYAGAQKNIGPSGVALVVFRRSLLERCDPELPVMLQYKTFVENGSMYNTPNTWAIFIIERVAAWIEEDCGGLEAVAAHNEAQAKKIYDVIDSSDFFRGHAQPESRSIMNITWNLPNAELETRFWKSAAEQGLSGLKGHRSVGGLRASIYNAQTDEAIDALVSAMREFERTHG